MNGHEFLPWDDQSARFWSWMNESVHFDSGVVGVLTARSPHPDGFVSAYRVKADLVEVWCEAGHRQDPMLRKARRSQVAVGKTTKTKPGPPLPPGQHALVLVASSLLGGPVWYLALGRKAKAFDELDQRLAACAFSRVIAGFNRPDEYELGRVLLGRDFKLIAADPMTDAWFIDNPNAPARLSEQFAAVLDQRWPGLNDRAPHDITLEIDGYPTWIRFRRAGIAGQKHGHWHLELRPVEELDVPPIGLVEDQRVSAALAYLSDRVAQTPSLNEVAEIVNCSPFHFHRLFSGQAGISPKHLVLRSQLREARLLLRATRLSVGKISAQTGFASHGHFTATFQKTFGLSPSEYREAIDR